MINYFLSNYLIDKNIVKQFLFHFHVRTVLSQAKRRTVNAAFLRSFFMRT